MRREDVQQLCREFGIVPSKAKGQNFLLDESYCDQMVQAAELIAEDTVIEIGPGFGMLTEKLLETGARVIAVELERKVFGYLKKRFGLQKNFELVEGNILEMTQSIFHTPSSLIKEGIRGRYKIVANLPYAITSPVLKKFLTAPNKPSQMVVMVQKEVAERICARPGEMSLLALSVQFYAHPRIITHVPRITFWPIPEVDSAIVSVCDTSLYTENRDQEIRVFRLARSAFAGKRKQLKTSLANGLHCPVSETIELLQSVGIDPAVRPQELGVEAWIRLAQAQAVRSEK